MRVVCIAVLMVTLSAASLGAAEQTATQLNTQAMQMVAMGVSPEAAAQLQNRFQEQQMVQVRNMIQAAKQQDLPVDAIVDKALEGIAKNIEARSIVNAMEQVRSRYAVARAEAVQMTQVQDRQQTMTRTMAHAMAAGIPPEDMAAIAAQVRTRQRTMTQAAYADLAQETFKAARDMARMGAKSEDVKGTLGLALQHQFTAMQMNQMRSRFMQQTRNTQPEVVASQFQSQVRAGHEVGRQGPGSGIGFGGGSGSGSGGSGSGSGGDSNGSGGSGGDGGSGGGGGGGNGGSGGGGGKN